MTNNILMKRIKEICESYNTFPTKGWITGDGPIPSDILFLGEAPGKTEIEQNKPFVGMAGKTFEGYLNSIGYERKDVRITNTCFFRPITIKAGKNGRETISNRAPKPFEVELFRDILNDEINMVNPKIIVTLGNTPLKRLTNFKTIGECHGTLWFNDEIKRNIFPMYHPSALTYRHDENFLKSFAADWNKLKLTLDTL